MRMEMYLISPELLARIERAFNEIPNTRLKDGDSTYSIASELSRERDTATFKLLNVEEAN